MSAILSATFGKNSRIFLLKIRWLRTLLPNGFLFLRFGHIPHRQTVRNMFSSILFRRNIQMRINVRRCGIVRVAQPDLDLLDGHTVSQQQACAGMPEIVKPDHLHLFRFQYIVESACNVFRFDQIALFVHADVVKILMIAILPHSLHCKGNFTRIVSGST